MKTKFLKTNVCVAAIAIFSGIILSAGLLFGTIKMIDATQTEVPACEQRARPECVPKTERPPCPEPKRLCTLNAAGQGEQLYHKE